MPKISVIISTYNRPDLVSPTIESLLRQTFEDYEIILVDNSIENRSPFVLKDLVLRSNGTLKLYNEPAQGKSRAVNKGITLAQGEIIALTDDDVIADPEWLSSIVKFFNEIQCDGIGGRVLPIYPPNTPSWVKDNPDQAAGTVVIYDKGDKVIEANASLDRFIGCNCAFKRTVFTDCGLFREDLGPGTPTMGEDEEFYERLLQHHKNLYYCPHMIIRHPVDLKRLSLKFISKWQITLGRFEAQKEIKAQGSKLTLWAGVPRYILKGIISDAFFALLNIFNVLKFRHYYRSYFRKLGMIYEYREIHRSS